MTFFTNIRTASRNRTTYRSGLLQARAYRMLKQHTNAHLADSGIIATHWALLGLLFEEKEGMRFSEAATELGVEAPFVTTLASDLGKKGLVMQMRDPSDSRAKRLQLTDDGRLFVERTERELRTHVRTLVPGISIDSLAGYFTVLESIVAQGGKNESGSYIT